MADYAIHEETLYDIADVIRKKDGSSALIDPADYAGRINLMGMLEEKTVSGSVVTFPDGADAVKLKSCEVTIAPTLDGVSSVDVVQTGKNLINIPDSAEITRNQLISNVVPLLDDFLNGKKGNYIISAKTAETVENANFITIRINYTDGTSSSNVYIYRGSTHESGGITGTFSISSDPTKTIDGVSFGGNTGTAKCAVSEWQIEANAQATAYAPYVTPTTHTANLGRMIYGGEVDVVNGTGTDENGNDFTFTPVPIISRLGDNTLWGDGDLSVTYRSSGTQTIITPTLISKTVTENGTYTASDEGADGYDEVTVNVQGGAQNIETVLSSNPLIEVSGVSGTGVERTMWTYTASASGKIVFHANTQVKTNTGSNDGYFTVKKNDTVIATTYANTSTTTALPIPDIDIESGDVVTITCGFDNSHTSCWFDIYSTITILTENTPSLLMGGLVSSNSEEENTNSEQEESET